MRESLQHGEENAPFLQRADVRQTAVGRVAVSRKMPVGAKSLEIECTMHDTRCEIMFTDHVGKMTDIVLSRSDILHPVSCISYLTSGGASYFRHSPDLEVPARRPRAPAVEPRG